MSWMGSAEEDERAAEDEGNPIKASNTCCVGGRVGGGESEGIKAGHSLGPLKDDVTCGQSEALAAVPLPADVFSPTEHQTKRVTS